MTPPAVAPEGVATLPAANDPAGRRRPRRGDRPGARVLRLAHGRLTLDELVSGAWAAIGAGAPAACPICDGAMKPRATGPAECTNCGTQLS